MTTGEAVLLISGFLFLLAGLEALAIIVGRHYHDHHDPNVRGMFVVYWHRHRFGRWPHRHSRHEWRRTEIGRRAR